MGESIIGRPPIVDYAMILLVCSLAQKLSHVLRQTLFSVIRMKFAVPFDPIYEIHISSKMKKTKGSSQLHRDISNPVHPYYLGSE